MITHSDFKTIEAPSPVILDQLVNQAINDGFNLHGTIIAVGTSIYNMVFIQAVSKQWETIDITTIPLINGDMAIHTT